MVKFKKKGVKVSPLFCDKLAFVIQYNTLADRDHIRTRLKSMKHASNGHFAGHVGMRKYYLGMKFYVGLWEQVDTVVIQADPKGATSHFLRIEYRPTYADPGTLIWLFDQILPGGWADIPKYAKCTRFDATVDVTGIDITELLVYYPGMQRSRAFFKGGRVETLEMGAYDGDKRVVVYDKCAQLKAYNLKHQCKSLIPDAPTTRIEIVMRPSRSFAALADMTNPFAGLAVHTVPPLASTQTVEFQLFLKVAQLGGLQQALLGLPEAKRKQFRSTLDMASCSWWTPDVIWSKWPMLLMQLMQVSPTVHKPLNPASLAAAA